VREFSLEQHEHYMQQALFQAQEAFRRAEVPIGAVVVSEDGTVLGSGYNRRETWKDPTAHAELIALRAAAQQLGDWRLYHCRLYVTVEPCVMCAGAIQLARIAEVIYGAKNPKGGALTSTVSLYEQPGFNHYPRISSGILGDQCAMMMADFFRQRRQ